MSSSRSSPGPTQVLILNKDLKSKTLQSKYWMAYSSFQFYKNTTVDNGCGRVVGVKIKINCVMIDNIYEWCVVSV